MKILYNFPSRERPYKFFNCLNNIVNKAQHDDYEIIATLDIDDTLMNNETVRKQLDTYEKVRPIWGTSRNKVDAINKNVYIAEDWDILCNHSDDMHFLNSGFDLEILEAFSDGFKGFVHFPDQRAKERLCTYSIMHKEYYDKFKYIYHPDYQSVYCDNEAHQVAVKLGLYKFVDKQILEHRHHINGFGPADDLLKRTEHPIVYHYDYQTFIRRQTKNFDL